MSDTTKGQRFHGGCHCGNIRFWFDWSAQVKAGNLKRWQIIQTGENSGLLINEFENKSQMNKYNKGVSTVRQDVDDAVGAQRWTYHGPVKASG